jgi:hypothetical protein
MKADGSRMCSSGGQPISDGEKRKRSVSIIIQVILYIVPFHVISSVVFSPFQMVEKVSAPNI